MSVDQMTPPTNRCELVWDLPNQNKTLTEISKAPGLPLRIDFSALGRFVVASGCEGSTAAATVFANVHSGNAGFESFLTAIRRLGFGVFARPKIDGSDIDDDLVHYVEGVADTVEHLLVGTHDRELIHRCVAAVPGTSRVTVLGFEERSALALGSEHLDFVDLEDIPGLFQESLVRESIRRLPPEGAFFPPMGPLGGGVAHVRRVSTDLVPAR